MISLYPMDKVKLYFIISSIAQLSNDVSPNKESTLGDLIFFIFGWITTKFNTY